VSVVARALLLGRRCPFAASGVPLLFSSIDDHHTESLETMSSAASGRPFFIVREVYHVHLEHLYPLPYEATTPNTPLSPS
jgi:hypothetical protein